MKVLGAPVNEGNWLNEALAVVDSGNVTGVDGLSYGFVVRLRGRLVKTAWGGADAFVVDRSWETILLDTAVVEDDGVLSVEAVKGWTELEGVIWIAEPKEGDPICRLLL